MTNGPLQKAVNGINQAIDYHKDRIHRARISLAAELTEAIELLNFIQSRNLDYENSYTYWHHEQNIAWSKYVISVHQQLLKEQEELLRQITAV